MHQIRHLAFRQPDQYGLSSSAELRFLELPERRIRGATLIGASLRRRPWEADRLAAAFCQSLTQEIEAFNPDVVHVNRWILAGLGRLLSGVPSVLSAFDAWHLNVGASVPLAHPLRRPLLRLETARIRRFEAQEFERFSRIVVVSEQDKAELHRVNPTLPIAVIPNGVDAEFFRRDPNIPVVANRMVFTGGMSYPPNVVAAKFLARDILPRVRDARPDAHVVIVGRNPHRDVRALRTLDGVEVTGEVDDVRPWLQSAHVFVCPMLSGTGIKNKLLEAMASELACVVTPLSLQGLGVNDGQEVVVGRSARELAAHVLRVLGDDVLARQLGRDARRYVLASHSWRNVACVYGEIYRDVHVGSRQ